ncbi:hypothetical protein HYS96_02870 [Candidatus Daviesbacteria bacterium]|nr:hypothetical protein [Candidatus Daviesbacteria bacterium]
MNELDRQALDEFRHEHEDVRPNPGQGRRLLRATLKTKEAMLRSIKSGDVELKGELLDCRAWLFATYQKVPSLPHLCAAYSIDLIELVVTRGYLEPLLEKIKRMPYLSTKEDIVEAVSWCDIMQGGTLTLGHIYAAEREIEGVSEQAIAATATLVTQNEGDAAQLYLKLQPGLKALSTEAAQLLLGDKGRTGLPLLEAQVQKLERVKLGKGEIPLPLPYHPFQIVSMLLAGAEMARDSYQVLYPIAEQLPPYRP